MKWTEIKKWAERWGYETLKEKNTENYLWTKKDDPSVTGISIGVGQLATDIYNHMTNNEWVEYQKSYKKNQTFETYNEY
jgi:hypothetical protein